MLPEDVTDLAPDVLRHRLVLSYEALADGITADQLIQRDHAARPAPEKPLETHVRVAAQRLTPSCGGSSGRCIRRLDGLLHGDYRTLFRGFGLDLADLREYQYHDDVRHIDWNVTARLQTPYVREYNEEREVTAWFLLDLSARRSTSARTTCASARVADRVRHGARAPADAPRQPRRRAVLRRRASTR